MFKKVDAFEMWCYRRILKINWFDGVTNAEVLNGIHTKLHFREDMRRKLAYAGHVLRGSNGLSHLQILEDPMEEKKKVDSPRRSWMKDILEWMNWNDNNTGEKTVSMER